jgi:excisionase family DNA binding protein
MPDPSQIPKLLSATDVAEILGVGAATVLREVHRRKLGCIRVGAQVRFTEQQIFDYLEQQTSKPRPREDSASALSTAQPATAPAHGDSGGKASGSSKLAALRLAHEIASRRT